MDPQFAAKFLDDFRTAAPPSPPAPSNREVLDQIYGAIVRKDFEALGPFFSDDVELEIRGSALFDGAWRGRDDVMDAIRRNFASVSNQQPVLQGTVADENSIVVMLREQGTTGPSNAAYSMHGVQWFTFAAGKLVKLTQIAARC